MPFRIAMRSRGAMVAVAEDIAKAILVFPVHSRVMRLNIGYRRSRATGLMVRAYRRVAR